MEKLQDHQLWSRTLTNTSRLCYNNITTIPEHTVIETIALKGYTMHAPSIESRRHGTLFYSVKPEYTCQPILSTPYDSRQIRRYTHCQLFFPLVCLLLSALIKILRFLVRSFSHLRRIACCFYTSEV